MKGVVLSDLHMYSMRSRADEVMDRVHDAILDADHLVLNGDTFDFRWSTLPSIEHSTKAALAWLEELGRRHEHCDIQVVLGNHDYHGAFIEGLGPLTKRVPNIGWHEYQFQIGDHLFLHGDCADYRMGANELMKNRQAWYGDRKTKPIWMGHAYSMLDRIGVSAALPRVLSQPHMVVDRIVHYMEDAAPGTLADVNHVYFGHTHLPFVDYEHQGILFHNTGSAVGDMEFNMLDFTPRAA